MKMIMAIVPKDEAECVLEALVAAGQTATFTESRGGALRQAQWTLFIAVEEKDLLQVLSIVQSSCRSSVTVEPDESETRFSLGPVPVTADLGGAVVFVWDIERHEAF